LKEKYPACRGKENTSGIMNNVSLGAVGLCALFISTNAASNAKYSPCSVGALRGSLVRHIIMASKRKTKNMAIATKEFLLSFLPLKLILPNSNLNSSLFIVKFIFL